MSQPDYGPPENSGPWPYEPPDPVPGYPDPDDRTEPYRELHHEDAVPGDPGPWDIPQDPAVPADWPGYGAYIPGPEDQSPWDDPPEPAPYAPPSYGARRHRSPVRPIMIAVLLLAVIAVGAGAALLHNGTIRLSPASIPRATATSGPGAKTATSQAGSRRSRPAATEPAAITKTEAEHVVSRYWQVNNEANESYSDSLLGTIESGSSYAMDTGTYRFDRASNPSNSNYVAFAPVHAAYYIPRQSVHAAYPHWFAVAVTDASLASPHHPAGSGYLLFSQASPGGAWKDVLEPDVVAGSGPAPHIATGAQGYATAVSPGSEATGLSIAPGQIAPMTAAALDNTSTAIKVPDNLTDEHDKAFWNSRLPAGSTGSDTHQPAPGPVFGLRTKDGGAILFYSLDAQLNLAPPPGETFQLEIPGYYSPSQTLTSAGVGYIEQFAAYDPPQGQADPHIAADVSSIASRD